ncbi:endospore germination permease [Bacillus mangrovi]|uniref:Endospore germination permease n=1 Tax=Metabacillus mangrovi TaxID=1491830 RepID=A0A7X2V4C5_9BACI|nr:endospore germination permease [Metabacillus mangrovi]MTH52979.1 endospore germination permease [Metabacillus mangrovi]
MNHILSRQQLFLLVISFITGSSVLMAPGLTASFAQNDAWISMVLAVLAGLLLNTVLIFLLKKYHYASIFEIFEKVLGKLFGFLLSGTVVFYSLHLAAYVLRNLSNFMTTSISPDSSPANFQILMLLIVMYSVFFGLNNLGRVNQFFIPLMLVLLFASLLLVLNQFKVSNLKPFFKEGFLPIVHGAYPSLGFPFIEIILMASILTYVRHKKKLGRIYLTSILIGGSILAVTVFISIGVQGYDLVTRQTYSTFELVRDITVIRLFERIEVLIGIYWIFGIFVKITFCLQTALLGFKTMTKHTTYRPFILPCSVFIWVMSNQLHPALPGFNEYVTKYWTLWWMGLYLLFIFVLAAGLWAGKHKAFNKGKNEI